MGGANRRSATRGSFPFSWEEVNEKHSKIILLVVVIVVAVPVLAILGIIYARRIKPNTVLVVRIEGEIPEATLAKLPAGYLQRSIDDGHGHHRGNRAGAD